MEDKKIKKDDLNVIAIDLLDLKFNRDGFELICDYVEEKLKEDGVKIEINTTKQYGIFNKVKFDYSIESKKEGIKEMVEKIIESGEERGLDGKSVVGVWLNHAVEFMGRRITEKITDKIMKVIEKRTDSLWMIFGRNTEKNLLNLNGVDIYKVDDLFKRTTKNIKRIKFNEFVRFNKFVW